MGKLLSWVLLIVLGWAIWKLVVISQRKQQARQAGRGQPGAGAGAGAGDAREPRAVGQGELMVRCAHCGIYLPQSEALAGGEHRYCSAAHRAAGPRDHERVDSDPAL
ncbi:MAG TPA: PP0621 family protein [Burkholderiaceae bacterium]|nr:PP0621 family protein [Burkholderiaceae bacterium]